MEGDPLELEAQMDAGTRREDVSRGRPPRFDATLMNVG